MKRFAFIASAGKWTYRDKGTERGLLTTAAAQTSVDAEFRSPKAVIRYGRHDKLVSVRYDTPQLADVNSPWLEDIFEKHRKRTNQKLTLGKLLVAEFWDTYPNRPRIVELEDGMRVFNLWSEPKVKAIRPDKYKEPRWFLDVVDRFFGDDVIAREYFLDWCAHLICHPEVKMPISMLLISTTGAGKNFIADALKWMVGERNTKSVTADSVKGSFQSFIPGTSLVVISELYEGGNYGFADKLKTLQSEDEVVANIKYGPMENVRNMTHFLAFSNSTMPLHLAENDRRWFIFSSPQREPMPSDWWDERWRVLKDRHNNGLPQLGKLGSLRRWFEERMKDIDSTGRFKSHARPPATEYKASIIEDSRSVFYGRVKEMMEDGKLDIDLTGRIRLSSIEDQIKAMDPTFRMPPPGQIREDLEALGFRYEKTKHGRFWIAPDECERRPGMPF